MGIEKCQIDRLQGYCIFQEKSTSFITNFYTHLAISASLIDIHAIEMKVIWQPKFKNATNSVRFLTWFYERVN